MLWQRETAVLLSMNISCASARAWLREQRNAAAMQRGIGVESGVAVVIVRGRTAAD
jgi:hypothetical protein